MALVAYLHCVCVKLSYVCVCVSMRMNIITTYPRAPWYGLPAVSLLLTSRDMITMHLEAL